MSRKQARNENLTNIEFSQATARVHEHVNHADVCLDVPCVKVFGFSPLPKETTRENEAHIADFGANLIHSVACLLEPCIASSIKASCGPAFRTDFRARGAVSE